MFGKNIRELRQERGLTQAELARKIGVTQGSVYFWEKEINEPTAGCLIKMADVFGVSIDEILSYECKTGIEFTDRSVEMLKLFKKLSKKQQQLLLTTAKEFLNC